MPRLAASTCLIPSSATLPWNTFRFEKRIFIGLPDAATRARIFKIHLGDTPHELNDQDFKILGERTEGFGLLFLFLAVSPLTVALAPSSRVKVFGF